MNLLSLKTSVMDFDDSEIIHLFLVLDHFNLRAEHAHDFVAGFGVRLL